MLKQQLNTFSLPFRHGRRRTDSSMKGCAPVFGSYIHVSAKLKQKPDNLHLIASATCHQRCSSNVILGINGVAVLD